jgi:gliding motility-associated-like protein
MSILLLNKMNPLRPIASTLLIVLLAFPLFSKTPVSDGGQNDLTKSVLLNSVQRLPITCNPDGNWLLISNYDGGNLNVIVDLNIPNLKIGICTYEPVNVKFSGPFLSAVEEVRYAGFNSAQNNNNCGFPISASTFSGVNASIVVVDKIPPVRIISPPNPDNILNLPNGSNSGVVCAYSCVLNSYQGGCNTLDQVIDYFQSKFGGSLRGLSVQYCCWEDAVPQRVSKISRSCCDPGSNGQATVTYPAGPFCKGDGNITPVVAGDNSGTFYSIPPGLDIDAATGLVKLSTSNPGEYEIVYANQVNCNEIFVKTKLTLNPGTSVPPAFSFPNPLCVAGGSAQPTPLAGFSTGGTFSVSPPGLIINPVSGTISLSNSQPGTYSVTYAIPASLCGAGQVFTFSDLVVKPKQQPYPLVLGDTCLSAPLSIRLNGTNGVESVQWNMGDPAGGVSNISNTTIHNHQYSKAGNFTIRAVVKYGCGADTINRTIQIVEPIKPQLTFAYPDDPCRMSNVLPQLAPGFQTGGVFSVKPALPVNSSNGKLGDLKNISGQFVVTYTFTATGCKLSGASSDTVSIESFSDLLSANPKTVNLLLGDTVQLNAGGTLNFSWQPVEGLSCSKCPSPMAYPSQTTQYIVTGIDSNGCLSRDTVLVRVDIICNEVFIPTIFSPNDKGPQTNETFCVFSNCVEQFKLVIHNRWGEKIFEADNISNCWDGKFKDADAPAGAYAFNLYLLQLDGKVLNKTGIINLLR